MLTGFKVTKNRSNFIKLSTRYLQVDGTPEALFKFLHKRREGQVVVESQGYGVSCRVKG